MPFGHDNKHLTQEKPGVPTEPRPDAASPVIVISNTSSPSPSATPNKNEFKKNDRVEVYHKVPSLYFLGTVSKVGEHHIYVKYDFDPKKTCSVYESTKCNVVNLYTPQNPKGYKTSLNAKEENLIVETIQFKKGDRIEVFFANEKQYRLATVKGGYYTSEKGYADTKRIQIQYDSASECIYLQTRSRKCYLLDPSTPISAEPYSERKSSNQPSSTTLELRTDAPPKLPIIFSAPTQSRKRAHPGNESTTTTSTNTSGDIEILDIELIEAERTAAAAAQKVQELKAKRIKFDSGILSLSTKAEECANVFSDLAQKAIDISAEAAKVNDQFMQQLSELCKATGISQANLPQYVHDNKDRFTNTFIATMERANNKLNALENALLSSSNQTTSKIKRTPVP